MNSLATNLTINLGGNLSRQAKRFQRDLVSLGRQGRVAMNGLGRGVGLASRGLDKFGNRYTGLATGAGAVAVGRWIVNEQRRFTRLGIQAGQSADSIARLKNQIYETARAPEIRVDADGILSAIEEIIEKTGDLKFAQDNIRNIGIALSATGAKGGAIGGIFAEFQKIGITDPDEVLQAIDLLNKQGKAGAFTLQHLSALGPRVVSAYAATGRGGLDMIREMGAVLQVIRQGTGSSEMAATAFEALIRTLMDAKKSKMLESGGIKIFDPEALQQGEEVMRPLNEIMTEIVKKSNGRSSILSQIFDAEAMRAFNAVSGEFKRNGNIDSLERFMEIQADGAVTLRDAARAAKDAAGGLTALVTSTQLFADGKLAPALLEVTDILNSLEASTVDRWLKIGSALAGLLVLNKLSRSAMAILQMLKPTTVGGAMFYGAGSAGLIPATGAAATAQASRIIGAAITDAQVAATGTGKLQQLRQWHMVMGGGADTYQVQAIDAELARRGIKGELKITITPEGAVKVDKLTSSPNFDIDVDAGQMMRSR